MLSGNGGNGLRITNSNDTTVQANFMGVGANNASIVANGGDGLLVSGSSENTQVGGVIPLGNVISGNDRNGIEVRGTASGFISFNTFAGIFAFGGAAPNGRDGILITSTGGNNLIRTCIVCGNLGNGIELGGNATGVQMTETAVGTNSNIQTAIPNGGNGIMIFRSRPRQCHRRLPAVDRAAGDGLVELRLRHRDRRAAHDNAIFHTYIGTNAQGTEASATGWVESSWARAHGPARSVGQRPPLRIRSTIAWAMAYGFNVPAATTSQEIRSSRTRGTDSRPRACAPARW